MCVCALCNTAIFSQYNYTIDLNTEPADYRFPMDTITIAGDSNNTLFAINIVNDNVRESNETFQVKILPSVGINIGTPSSVTVTIIDYFGEYACLCMKAQ